MEKVVRMSHKWVFIASLLLVVAFNNCASELEPLGEGSESSSLSASRAICDAQLKAAFQRTYHPFLVQNCNGCHSAAQGSRDLNVSYNAFTQRGAALINFQSTHAHGGNSFDDSMNVKLDVFRPSWESAQVAHLNCVANAGTNKSGGTVSDLLLNSKQATPDIAGLMNTLSNQSAWVNIEWDLEQDVNPVLAGRFKALLKVEARLSGTTNNITGISFRNPKLRLKAGAEGNIRIDSLAVVLDDTKQPLVTTFFGLSRIVEPSTADVPLVDQIYTAYANYPAFQASTSIALEIGEISITNDLPTIPSTNGPIDPIPFPVIVDIPAGGLTYTQLVSSDSNYRVLGRSCTGCHRSNSGRLNLNDYATARDNAALIISRMNDTQNPMPPSGILLPQDRDMVQSWVNTGLRQ